MVSLRAFNHSLWMSKANNLKLDNGLRNACFKTSAIRHVLPANPAQLVMLCDVGRFRL